MYPQVSKSTGFLRVRIVVRISYVQDVYCVEGAGGNKGAAVGVTSAPGGRALTSFATMNATYPASRGSATLFGSICFLWRACPEVTESLAHRSPQRSPIDPSHTCAPCRLLSLSRPLRPSLLLHSLCLWRLRLPIFMSSWRNATPRSRFTPMLPTSSFLLPRAPFQRHIPRSLLS